MEPATHWWLDEGGETCPRCLEVYAYEVEVRCVECDGPLCPHCAVRVTAHVGRCSDCHEPQESDAPERAS